MNIRNQNSFNVVKILLVAVTIGLIGGVGWYLFLRDNYSVSNPPSFEYFTSKYKDLNDTKACVDEWHKYYPPKDGLEQTLTGIPCPGEPQ